MSFSSINDEKRNSCVKILNKIINDEIISRNIEKNIYNSVIEICKNKNITKNWNNKIFIDLYLSKIRSIYSNINSKSYIKNTKFLDRIKSGEININNIGKLSVHDIFPDNWKYIMEVQSKRDKIKYELKPEAMTDTFKCNRCGSRETSYYEVQTRSADEPMTQFITCLNCNARWKQ
jgi:DNA-directed RNA polymerase subunit M/transcription elongation factor TFIIS